MSNPTPNMNLLLPTDGGSPNVWNVYLDTVFGQIDSHTHVTGQGIQVPTLGLNINSDLTFAVNSATNLKASVFSQVATGAVSSYANALFVNSADQNLYFRNAGGTNVQITSGNTLNVSIVGGIGGDYSSVSALVQYNDASRTYWLQQEGAPRPWAKLGTGDINLYQAAASIANYVGLKSPNALAATYTLTFPAALPGNHATPVLVDSSGNMTMGTVLQSWEIPASAADAGFGPATAVYDGTYTALYAWKFAVAAVVTFPIPYVPGKVITKYLVYLNKSSNASTTIQAQLLTMALGVPVNADAGVSTSANAPGAITLQSAALSVQGTLGTPYFIRVYGNAATGAADTVLGCTVEYTD